MERDQRIGLNIGSGLPWTAAPVVGLPLAAWMTRRAGYDFWQVLPFRSVTVAGLKRTRVPIRFAEPAWNATTLWAHLRGEPGVEGPTKWQDPLFFPGPEKCEGVFDEIVTELGPTPVWHDADFVWLPGLTEVHPGLGMTISQLLEAAKKGGWPETRPHCYVIDLRHLRRIGDNGLTFGPWRVALAALLPCTGLIHVQASAGEEWRGFINGKPTELARMLRFARDWGYTGPFVVEYDTRATGLSGLLPWVLAKNLRLVRERIEENIESIY